MTKSEPFYVVATDASPFNAEASAGIDAVVSSLNETLA